MKKFNKLLIVGDSFCKDRYRESDWPVALGKLLDCKVHGQGRGGCSWWSSKHDVNNFKKDRASTILIVVHTDANRLPNDFDYPVSPRVLASTSGILADHLKHRGFEIRQLALDFYNSKLFSPEFYQWAQQAWIAELDQCNDFYATIHIPAFDNVKLSGVKNGIVLTPSTYLNALINVSNAEVGNIKWCGSDNRANHLKDVNNVKFAEALRDVIVSLPAAGAYTFGNMSEWDLTPVEFKQHSILL